MSCKPLQKEFALPLLSSHAIEEAKEEEEEEEEEEGQGDGWKGETGRKTQDTTSHERTRLTRRRRRRNRLKFERGSDTTKRETQQLARVVQAVAYRSIIYMKFVQAVEYILYRLYQHRLLPPEARAERGESAERREREKISVPCSFIRMVIKARYFYSKQHIQHTLRNGGKCIAVKRLCDARAGKQRSSAGGPILSSGFNLPPSGFNLPPKQRALLFNFKQSKSINK